MSSLDLPWLMPGAPFPDPRSALIQPAGLLAAGGDLTVQTLRRAYSKGIFPWFNQGEPILWWSPEPRMVLDCDKLHISHSLKKRLKQIATQQALRDFGVVVTVDTQFEQVIAHCATTLRDGQPGTWITQQIQQAYRAWHQVGQAHSIETWMDGELVGGLYGISLGTMFFGESMFMHRTDASKIAFVHLVNFLKRQNVRLIDCQMETAHLASFGAAPIARAHFLQHLEQTVGQADLLWRPGWIDHTGQLQPLTLLA